MRDVFSKGSNAKEDTLMVQLKKLIPEYKVIYLLWIYAKELLPDHNNISCFEQLKDKFKMIPNATTEESASRWLLEERVQAATKYLLKRLHNRRLVDLYNLYFEKAKEDVASFRAFTDFSEKFFADESQTELQKIISNIVIDEESGDDSE